MGRLRRPFVFFALVCLVGMGLGFSCGNFVFLAKALVELTGADYRLVSLMIYGLIFFLLIIIREPEKIKVLAYVIAAFIFFIGRENSCSSHSHVVELYDMDVQE